jgi:streptomycin 6-kinase
MFTDIQINKITESWGKGAHLKILKEIETYSKKWELSNLSFYESYSMNAIFSCTSEIYGECVLKIGNKFQDDEFLWEYNVLREYNGRSFVKVFESDIEIETGKKIMLIERISPGRMLQEEKNLDKRLTTFSELFKGLHIKPQNTALYKRYGDGINDCVEKMSKRNDCKDLYYYMMKAKDIHTSVSAIYNKEMLLHGDLHYHNILLRDNGKYAIIDPQGRVGDSIFDIPRYVLIEYYNMPVDERINNINHIFDFLEKDLNIPSEILRQCFYIETVSFECWWASIGDYTIGNVVFAETMMKQRNS